jgi:hypothetical protein
MTHESLDATREELRRVLVDLSAKGERLALELLPPTIDDGERGFQDAMAAESEGISGQRFAKNRQIVVITEQGRQMVDPFDQLLLIARPGALEKLQLMP